ERVADLLGGIAGEVLQHPRGVDRHVAGWAPQYVEDRPRRRRDRSSHFHAVRQEDGIGHLVLLVNATGGGPTSRYVAEYRTRSSVQIPRTPRRRSGPLASQEI